MGKFNHDYKAMQSIGITGAADYTLIHANNHIASYVYYIILSYITLLKTLNNRRLIENKYKAYVKQNHIQNFTPIIYAKNSVIVVFTWELV